jgi:hypothetical protein
LSFQLSNSQEKRGGLIETKQRSDVRPVDDGPATGVAAKLRNKRPGSDILPGQALLPRTRNIRFSKYGAAFSDFARSASTYSELYFREERFSMAKLCGRAFLPPLKERVSSPWFL